MPDSADRQKIFAGISDKQVLALEQAAIRIPSTTFGTSPPEHVSDRRR
jgi:hypothetical protein